MSKNLGNPISSGRTAEIYNWDQEQIIKLFHSWVALESIENEAWIAGTIYKSGLPVPEAGEMVRVDGRTGLIYQRVHGDLDVQGSSAQTVEYHSILATFCRAPC